MYWRVPRVRSADVCARYGVTAAELRRARKEIPIALTAADTVLIALAQSDGRLDVPGLIATLDWLDRTTWSPDDLRAVLVGLEEAGVVQRNGDHWVLSPGWP